MMTPVHTPGEKVVLHLKDKSLLKGTLKRFSEEADVLTILPDDAPGAARDVALDQLKSVFYVKTYDGNKEYKEKKRFGLMESKGRKVIVKFSDGELVTGFVEKDVPWDKGFFLSILEPNQKGFYLYPSDPESNNVKIFIVASSVVEVQRF